MEAPARPPADKATLRCPSTDCCLHLQFFIIVLFYCFPPCDCARIPVAERANTLVLCVRMGDGGAPAQCGRHGTESSAVPANDV